MFDLSPNMAPVTIYVQGETKEKEGALLEYQGNK